MLVIKVALRAPVSPRIMAWPPRGPPRYRESPSRCRCSTATAAVGSAASEVMMLGSGEFVMLLLRCCLLLMRWLLVLLLLLRPRGRTGARPMRASSPSVGANSIISSRRNVLLGCTECAVRALSEKVRGGCVHSLYSAGPGMGRVREFKPCRHCEFEFLNCFGAR